jgi:hypothetical protein
MTSPPPPLPPQAPKLPSRGVSAILAALMLAAGIAAGALIGPGPAASLASTSRAGAVGRVLALLALGEGAGGGSGLLLSSGAGHTSSTLASQPAPSTASKATSGAGSGQAEAGGGAANSSSPSPSTASSSPKSGASEGPASPTRSTTPAAGSGESETTKATTPLPPVAHVWLIVLPYGTSVTNALGQSAAAPYIDGQLATQGTVLSAYTSLAAGQLAGAATLLSGQEAASVSTVSPPPCTTAAAPTATGQGTTAPGQGTAAGSATGTPCPSGEPAGVAAANAFVAEVVPKIVASTTYKEHGLVVITFAPANPEGPATGAGSTPSTGTPSTEGAGAEVAYPAGTLTTTLTAAGPPAGALVLSPFLRHPGKRVASAFDPQAPRTSLEGLLQAKAAGA